MHQQKAYFAQVFDTVAPNYDQIGPPFHAAFGRRFVQAAELQPGARLLDVACGRGATLLPAAEIAGADGIAVGVDISGGMARVAAADARRRGLAHVTTARMDGEQLAFRAGTFDAVLCSAALFFFPDEERALREFYRVLAPGGLAGYTVYQRVEPDHEYAWMFEILARYQRPPGEPEPEPESLPELPPDQRATIREMLAGAGFDTLRIVPAEETFFFADEQEWWDQQWHMARRGLFERMDPDRRERLKAELFAGFQPHKQADGRIPITIGALFAFGAKKQ